MSMETDRLVLERYIHAVARSLPRNWHCVTILMMAPSDDETTHTIATYCDTPPTSIPALLRAIAESIEAQHQAPYAMDERPPPDGTH